MSLPPRPGRPPTRRNTIRGTLMQDVSQGKERVRAWPRPRPGKTGRGLSVEAQNFRALQLATKYLAPQMHTWAKAQVAGSPLLTRDVLTMMLAQRIYAFTLPNGKVIYPVPARSDVSESLDVLGNNPGDTLVRGQSGWEARSGPSGAPLGYEVLIDQTITSPTPYLEATDLEPYTDLFVFFSAVTLSANQYRCCVFSTDNGASYRTGAGDYSIITSDGTLSGSDRFNLHSGTSTSPRYAVGNIQLNPPGIPTMFYRPHESQWGFLAGITARVNAIRLRASGSGNMTGGRVILLAR